MTIFFDKQKFVSESDYNEITNETNVTTVLKNVWVVAKRSGRLLGQIVSQEKGTLISVIWASNAIGNSTLPMFLLSKNKLWDLS